MMTELKYLKGHIGTVRHNATTDHGFFDGQKVRIFDVDEDVGYSAEAVDKVGDGRNTDGPWFLRDDDLGN